MECPVKMQGDLRAWCSHDVITCRLPVIIPLDTAIAGPHIVSEDASIGGSGYLDQEDDIEPSKLPWLARQGEAIGVNHSNDRDRDLKR